MADVLAIDWNTDRVCGVQADLASGSLRIQSSFSFDVPTTLSNPAEVGAWLKGELQRARISARSVYLTVPREDVVVRHLELPPVDDNELPELVRFQAASRSTIPLDQLALDYLPMAHREGFQGREVLVASINRQKIRDTRTAFASAGLDLSAVGVSSIAATHLVSETSEEKSAQASELSLIIARHGDRIELSILGHGSLYFSHSTQVDSNDAAQSQSSILADISRSMIALQKRLPDARIARAWILGSPGEDSDLAAAIHERFRCTLHRVDPFSAQGMTVSTEPGDESHAAYAGPIGMLLGRRYESSRTLDFLNPRRATVKRDLTQIRRISVVAAGLVVIIGFYVYRGIHVAGLEAATRDAQEQTTSQKELLKKLGPQVAIAESVDGWAGQNVNWLNESMWLTETMQGTERQYLTQIRLTGGNKTKKGTVTLTGYAKERADAHTLNAELLERKNVDVQAKENNRSGRDGQYEFQFKLDVTLKKDDQKS
jgi:Tfp pilus assembly PilM family ATPase